MKQPAENLNSKWRPRARQELFLPLSIRCPQHRASFLRDFSAVLFMDGCDLLLGPILSIGRRLTVGLT